MIDPLIGLFVLAGLACTVVIFFAWLQDRDDD